MHGKPNVTAVPELSWLTEVRESGPRLSQQSPIGVRHFVVRAGPAMLHPECHPYCELGLHLSGRGIEYVERAQALRHVGDLFLAGPGVPHWFKITRYPLTGTAVYFLPSLLCELGPRQDGLHLLRRFTARQDIRTRLVRLPAGLRRRYERGLQEMHQEFARPSLGCELRLRAWLMDLLVELVRWERRTGAEVRHAGTPLKWEHVNRALHYLREHFAEPVYAHDVAKAVGVSESRLKVLFREALGLPWSRYIQGYRIQQAVALLSAAHCNVTEAALAVGFDSLSHFNATFRAYMGVSPSAYLQRQPKTANVSPKNGGS